MAKKQLGRRILKNLTTPSDDQGLERNRRAMLTALMNVISQIIQIATGLISVPLSLHYIGPERFGIWMTLSTALAFITFSDLGVGIGVQDTMSKCVGIGDYDKARRSFFSAFFFVTIIFVLLMTLSEIIVPRFDLAIFFSLESPEAIAEIIPTTLTVVFCLALGLLAGIVNRAFNALQEGFWVAVIQACARICSLGLLFVVVHLKMGLPTLIFVVGGLSSAVLLLVGLPVLFLCHKWMKPAGTALSDFIEIQILKDILKIGTLGLGAAVAIYFVNNTITFVMARKHGAAGVADYAVLLKLISVPGLLLTYLLLPLWPAITEANVRKDKVWIKKIYSKCILLTLGLAIISFSILLSYGQAIIRIWTGSSEIVPAFTLILASAVFMIMGYWNTLTSVMLNGLSDYKGQATYGLLLAIIFAVIAIVIPTSWSKEMIVWIVTLGYFLRCTFMQIELHRWLR